MTPPHDDAEHRDGPTRRLATWLDGPPALLPPALDRLAERWAAAGPRMRLLVGAAGVTLALVLLTVRAATSPWGEPVPAVIAVRTLQVAEIVADDDVREVERPVDLLPHGAITRTEDVVGRAATRTIPVGATLTVDDVAHGGPAAHLPPGLVAFPLPPAQAGVEPGQRVDLVTGDGSGAGHLLASAALVLAVGDETVWVAIRREEAPALAGASRWGEVIPVLLPP